jgi:acyl-CoA synthetase (AMP-forming)/AMP-acid ligase II
MSGAHPMTADASIPALLTAAANERGDDLAVVDGGHLRSWAGLHERALAFAADLVSSGVEPGDRVAIWAPNGLFWIEAVFGTWMAGAVLVPINTRFKGPEAAVLLLRSRAKVLVTTRTFLGTDYVAMLEGAGTELPDLVATIVQEEQWDPEHAAYQASALEEVQRRAAALTPDDRSDILFTSGTTGVPKGVVMTHGRTLRVASDWVAMTGLSAADRYLMVNPYFHMFGLKAGILAATVAGATMHPEPVFDAGRALQRVAAEGITVFPGAPTIYQSLLDHPDRDAHDLSTLRVAVTGAADIPVRLIERVREELPFRVVVTGYGLSEAGTASATVPEDDPETVATTVGRARPGFQIRIADDREGRLVDQPVGEPGEVVLRGPSVMAEYLDDPESTRAALSPDGWLRTGDLGVLDERGNLRIVGRIKDLFIVGGFNAYPAEIENALLRHPAVQQVAVIGIPDERLGEVGMAFVVPTPEADRATLAADVLAWAKDQMANYKVPRRIELLDALPTNATGKVVKDELRARPAP